MKLGIIGGGNVGGTLGKAWARRGHDICYGVTDPSAEKTRALVRETGAGARAGKAADAAAFGDIVVLAAPWSRVEAILQETGGLAGKIVIDCTNPLGMVDGNMGLVIGHTTSAGETVQRLAPDACVVKSLNTTGFGNMADPVFGGHKSVMFIAGDDDAAKRIVGDLVGELGFEVIDAGAMSAARLLEPHAMLWIHLARNRGLGRDFAFALLRR